MWVLSMLGKSAGHEVKRKILSKCHSWLGYERTWAAIRGRAYWECISRKAYLDCSAIAPQISAVACTGSVFGLPWENSRLPLHRLKHCAKGVFLLSKP